MSTKEAMLDAFNARDLTPASVARSFVPSPKYSELSQATHSILIGPRGSGKTTLLKMLSLDALRSWAHPDAASFRAKIGYTGIFVPADITWGAMVDSLAGNRPVPKELSAALGEVAFCINVFMASSDAMAKRLAQVQSRHTDDAGSASLAATREDFESLIESIASSWLLPIKSLSFRGIGQALNARLSDLYSQAKLISHAESPSVALLHELAPYSTLNVFASLTAALNDFNAHIGDEHGRWALLLDEFEVVPAHIQQQVLTGLRASNRTLIFKVALAPCGAQTGALLTAASRPNEVDDVRRIELWYREKNEVISFCKALFESRMQPKGISSPEQMLGRTEINDGSYEAEPDLFEEEPTTAWGKTWSKTFQDLENIDDSFRQFLANKGVNAKNLLSSPKLPNGNTLRKIGPIVAFRAAYRSKDGGIIGRKTYRPPYVGWDAIATISEGNPRWLIGMLEGLERELPGEALPLDSAIQWQQVERTVASFRAKIKTVAMEENMGISTNVSIVELLDAIGHAFQRELIASDFSEDPPATFVVDDTVSKEIEDCLRIALNFGGIVCFDPPDHVAGYDSLKGKQFRIAYILAPEYCLPLRKGKPRRLSTLLNQAGQRSSAGQGHLF